MQVSDFPAKFKADFCRFRRISAVFRPISVVSAAGRYDPIWPIWPNSGRISPVWHESKPIRHELSLVEANRAASARIKPSQRESKKKKEKSSDTAPTRGQPRWTLCPASDLGAAPSQPRPCFLDEIQ